MKILKGIGISLLVIIVLFLAVALFLPSEYKVERSITINKKAEVVYPMVAELENWIAWNPWSEADPDAKNEFSGTQGEVGSKWTWNGELIGVGSMKLVDKEQYKSLAFEMEFLSPNEFISHEKWTFTESDGKTKVVWYDHGEMGYPFGRYLSLMMDGMLGPAFEKGLEKLKDVSEAKPADKMKQNKIDMDDDSHYKKDKDPSKMVPKSGKNAGVGNAG